MKSHRRRDGWKQARDRARLDGKPMMKTCPAWLDVTADGFRVKHAAAETVCRIHAMARDGLGVHRIADRLNRDGVPPIGNGGRWVKAYVFKILTSPAAMGTYQPMRNEGKKSAPDGPPIPGFYPAIVTEAEWNETQAAIQSRGGELDENGQFKKGGKASREPAARAPRRPISSRGWFTPRRMASECTLSTRWVGRAKASESGIAISWRRSKPEPPGGLRIDYSVFERAVLRLLKELTPADVAPEGQHTNGREAEIARLSGRLLDIDDRLARTKQRARTAGDFDVFLDLIEELQAERKQVSARRAELEQDRDSRSSADLGETQSLIDMLDNTPPEQREEVRRRLKGRIRQLVKEIWVVVVRRGAKGLAAVQLWFRNSERHRDYLILHTPGNRYSEGRWKALSMPQKAPLDLRKATDAAKLQKVLLAMELE